MIIGTHILFYTKDPEADRAFLRDVLGFPHVDDGGGWLIFKMPAAEAGVHPMDDPAVQSEAPDLVHAEVYLMCDDVEAEVTRLKSKGVQCFPPAKEDWGIRTGFALPSGAIVGMYQPLHKSALNL
jgi:catechol 2,3-dioxygenase-like lactoylglutathione lyase family enzyme